MGDCAGGERVGLEGERHRRCTTWLAVEFGIEAGWWMWSTQRREWMSGPCDGGTQPVLWFAWPPSSWLMEKVFGVTRSVTSQTRHLSGSQKASTVRARRMCPAPQLLWEHSLGHYPAACGEDSSCRAALWGRCCDYALTAGSPEVHRALGGLGHRTSKGGGQGSHSLLQIRPPACLVL